MRVAHMRNSWFLDASIPLRPHSARLLVANRCRHSARDGSPRPVLDQGTREADEDQNKSAQGGSTMRKIVDGLILFAATLLAGLLVVPPAGAQQLNPRETAILFVDF